MGIESYVIEGVAALNISPTLTALREMAQGFRGILEQMTAIKEMQTNINRSMSGAGKAFADGMAKGAASAAQAATSAEAVSKAMVVAAQTQAQASATIASNATRAQQYGPPPLLMLPAPQRGFQTQGDSYGPGTALVPVGQPYGPGYTGGYASTAEMYAANGATTANLPALYRDPRAGTGFTMGATPPPRPGVDEPFNEPGPVRLYDRPSNGDFMAGAYGAQMLGNASDGIFRESFMAAAGVDQLKGALAAQGFSTEQRNEAYSAAIKAQQNVMGTYVGKNIELIIKMMGLTQDADLAIGLMPEMARAQQVFTGLGRNGEHEIYAAMQSGELRGVLYKKDAQTGKELPDTDHIRSFLRNMESLTAMSGGRYGPGEILQLLKSGGIAAGVMSDENGFAEMMPFIQSMGAARAGTALRAFSREFPGGKMSDASFNRLTEMGIIAHPELAHKIGVGYYQLDPGAISNGDFQMAAERPQQFIMERLLPKVQAYDIKSYGKAYTQGTDQQRLEFDSVTMGQIASMIPGGVLMSEMLRLAPLSARDVAAYKRQAGGDAYDTVVAHNPLMQLEGFRASENAMMVTLGADNMAVSIAAMKALTSALNTMSGVFSANPRLGRDMMLVADALMVMAPAISTLMIAVPAIMAFSKFAKWASPAAGSTVATGAGGLVAPAALVGASAYGISGLLNYGSSREADLFNLLGFKGLALGADKMAGMSDKDIAAKYHITVQNFIDGKEVGSSAIKTIVKGADGPSNGSNDFDQRRGYSPVEH